MRANSNLFWILAAFFWVADIAYIIWSLHDRGQVEWVGTVGMTLSGILGAFLAFDLGRTHAGQGGELPQDTPTANIDDGDPEMGQFSPWSWWPFALGLGLALMFLGLAVGVWIAIIGAPIALISVIGWYYEYYRGNFAR